MRYILKRSGLLILLFVLLALIPLLIHKGNPNPGILLNNGWKLQAGDDILWADPAFIDKDWIDADPTMDIHSFLPVLKPLSTGWLRIKIPTDISNSKEILALKIQQSVASEIYLNGKLLQRYGDLGEVNGNVTAFDPMWKPLALPMSGDTSQVLAIRFAIQPDIKYTTIFETANPLLNIHVLPLQEAISNYNFNSKIIEGFEFFLIGISVLFFILHFSFYILYPRQKANLYFALCAILTLVVYVLRLNLYIFNNSVSAKFYLANIAFMLLTFANLVLLLSLHQFLERKKDLAFKVLSLLAIGTVILNAGFYDYGWKAGGLVIQFLILLNIARIAFLSVIEKKKGAWIIAGGFLAAFVFLFSFVFQGSFTNPSFVQTVSIARVIAYIGFTISLIGAASIYLAMDFAFTNKVLQQKILEIREISDKNFAQEKEKQELLSSMNEKLETKVKERTDELRQSLIHLQATQRQLVQREKIASLGELVAGIAHEIQNPLNFVNNFSEVNKELTDELEQEIDKRNYEEAKVIAKDIKINEEKINHHGKRADAIVKGMLQHSRSSSGVKEPTDINALCDEYLRLSYHGLRAKDKSFNATMKTDFDKSIGNINIIPQDIGRVILNLITNAFYAVNERKKQQGDAYEPLVTIETKPIKNPLRGGRRAEIRVIDNGNGIPQKIVDKIFQPFFTTKPTGQGTGLGLSLSYDIVKAHGGELKVETLEGQGSVFSIFLDI